MGKLEIYFQNTLSVLFKLMGLYVQVERHTSRGRMDVTIQTRDYVYVMELKVDKSADEALKQIEDKQYAAPFSADPKQLFKVGVCFGSESKGIVCHSLSGQQQKPYWMLYGLDQLLHQLVIVGIWYCCCMNF